MSDEKIETKIENTEQKDLVELVRTTEIQDDDLDSQIARNVAQNITLTETDVHMFGDRTVIAQVIQLLAYIRHAVKNNMQTEITVRIGNTVANSEFMFDVNGCQIPDLVTKEIAEIN